MTAITGTVGLHGHGQETQGGRKAGVGCLLIPFLPRLLFFQPSWAWVGVNSVKVRIRVGVRVGVRANVLGLGLGLGFILKLWFEIRGTESAKPTSDAQVVL